MRVYGQALLLMAILENLVECAPEKLQVVFRRREFLTAALCGLAFLLALPHVTQVLYSIHTHFMWGDKFLNELSSIIQKEFCDTSYYVN